MIWAKALPQSRGGVVTLCVTEWEEKYLERFIWLNPVVKQYYDMDRLAAELTKKGFKIIEPLEDHLKKVLDSYRASLNETENCVIDARCPLAAEYVRDKFPLSGAVIPDIEPILISCARELLKRYKRAVITTPCKSLADFGNAKGIDGAEFLPWNEFCDQYGIESPSQKPEKSPIPPGFFRDIEGNLSISGMEDIHELFSNAVYNRYRIVEMLACEQGCHNGDGFVCLKR